MASRLEPVGGRLKPSKPTCGWDIVDIRGPK
jgi:hypothetical protein